MWNEALDWNGPKPETVNGPTLQSLASLNGLPTSHNTLPRATKRKLVMDAVDWIRNNEPAASVDDPMVRAIGNLDEVLVSRKAASPPGEKEPILIEALDWNGPKPKTVDEPTSSSTLPCATKKKLVKDAVDWIRNNEPTTRVDDPTVQVILNLVGVPVPLDAASPSGEKELILN